MTASARRIIVVFAGLASLVFVAVLLVGFLLFRGGHKMSDAAADAETFLHGEGLVPPLRLFVQPRLGVLRITNDGGTIAAMCDITITGGYGVRARLGAGQSVDLPYAEMFDPTGRPVPNGEGFARSTEQTIIKCGRQSAIYPGHAR